MIRALALALFTALAALPAAAQNYLGTYTAWISNQDLYNSNGQRLTEAWQIVRQDRANVHRFNRIDAGDAIDGWFANANARVALEQALRNGGIDPNSRVLILQGNSWVQVDLYGWGAQITGARASAYR